MGVAAAEEEQQEQVSSSSSSRSASVPACCAGSLGSYRLCSGSLSGLTAQAASPAVPPPVPCTQACAPQSSNPLLHTPCCSS